MTALTDKLTQLKLDFMAKELDRVLTDAAVKSLSPSAALGVRRANPSTALRMGRGLLPGTPPNLTSGTNHV